MSQTEDTDAGHRRGAAEAGFWVQDTARNERTEAGFRMQKQDLGCRYGMEGAGQGMVQPWSITAQAWPRTGILRHPQRWGVWATSREMQISKEKLQLLNPVQGFRCSSPIWEAEPGRVATSARQMCWGGNSGRGTEPPWMGKPPRSPLRGLVWELRSPVSHLLQRNTRMGPGRSWKGPIRPRKLI